MTFIEYYFAGVQHIQNFVQAAAIVAILALGSGVVSGLVFGTPFLSFVYIRLFLGEQTLIGSIVGLVIIVFGIVLQSVSMRKR